MSENPGSILCPTLLAFPCSPAPRGLANKISPLHYSSKIRAHHHGSMSPAEMSYFQAAFQDDFSDATRIGDQLDKGELPLAGQICIIVLQIPQRVSRVIDALC